MSKKSFLNVAKGREEGRGKDLSSLGGIGFVDRVWTTFKNAWKPVPAVMR